MRHYKISTVKSMTSDDKYMFAWAFLKSVYEFMVKCGDCTDKQNVGIKNIREAVRQYRVFDGFSDCDMTWHPGNPSDYGDR